MIEREMEPICNDQLTVCMQYLQQMKTQVDESDLICEAKIESKLLIQKKQYDSEISPVLFVALGLLVVTQLLILRNHFRRKRNGKAI